MFLIGKQIVMFFFAGCMIFIVICEGICKMLGLGDFNKKAWVYAIVGVFGSFLLKNFITLYNK